MLLVYAAESAMNEAEREHCYDESGKLCADLAANGQFIAAAPLHPVSTATSVRIRDGRSLITDGPFAETHEQLGGFYMIDAANLDEAIAIAERVPPARVGTIEVRPIVDLGDRLPA